MNALLFGNSLGVTDVQVLVLLGVAVAALAALAVMGRPLLFASIDPDVAAARGVPVRMLSVAFLMLLGAAVAETSQITGPLLVFALLVTPAATAQIVTARPILGLVLSASIGVAATWLGLAIAYFSPYPIGFCVTTVAFAGYVLAHAVRAAARFGRPWLRVAGGTA